MAESWLGCVTCAARYPLAGLFRGCPACLGDGIRSPLEVRYAGLPATLAADDRETGVFRWRDWLPPVSRRITLDEGRTPLLEVSPGLWVKNETRNPTWSWKDRPNAMTTALASQSGFTRLAVVSTGNHGAAAAAYSAVHGLACTVFCHPEAPPMLVALMRRYGANVVMGGAMGGDREALLEAELARGDTFPGTTLDARHGYTNPFGIEGFKTIAFEIAAALGRVDRVYVPTGSGDGVYGIWKGFRELHEAGVLDRPPRIVACQAAGAASLAKAFAAKAVHVSPISEVRTRALSIAEAVTGDGALRAVYESGGRVALATDAQAWEAMRVLGGRGIGVELSSAVAAACALADRGDENAGETWVTVGSGAVVKWPDDLADRMGGVAR